MCEGIGNSRPVRHRCDTNFEEMLAWADPNVGVRRGVELRWKRRFLSRLVAEEIAVPARLSGAHCSPRGLLSPLRLPLAGPSPLAILFFMRTLLLRALFLTISISSGLVENLRSQPINPLVREGVTERISSHIYVIPDGSMALVPNVGIIVGTRATLVVDTGLGERNGEAVMREVRKISQHPELYLVTTHVHPEHDLGAGAFPATTKMLRSTDQQKDIQEFGLEMSKVFSARSPFIADLLKGAQFRKADIVFENEYSLDLGGVHVRLVAMGANHTRGDTIAWVEPDRVLFSGDIAMKAQPAFASPYSTVSHWLASLTDLEKLAPQRIVPSHGPMGDLGFVAGYRAYLTQIQSRSAALKKEGKSVEQTTEIITMEMKAKYPDPARLAGAVKAAYQEAP